MGAITAPIGARTAFTITLTSLAGSPATYVASSAVDLSSVDAIDMILEVTVTPGTVSGNKRAQVFVQVSLDGTNYTTGPTSGTTYTDEPNLYFIGTLPLASASTLQRGMWSLVDKIGFMPNYVKLIVLNDSGAAFAASNCNAYYATVTGNAA